MLLSSRLFKTVSYRSLMTFFTAFLLMFSLGMQSAEAARLGSGKTFGKTYSTPAKPAYSPTYNKSSTTTNPATGAAAAQTAKKPGFMGGMLGGLLMGGLLGGLLFGGVGGGLLDILVLAALAFLAYRFFTRRKQAQSSQADNQGYAHAGANNPWQARNEQPAEAVVQPQTTSAMRSGSFGSTEQGLMAELADEVKIPDWFKKDAFLEEAKDHFRALQKAWDSADYATLSSYMTPELFAQIKAEREQMGEAQHTEVVSVMTDLVDFQQVGDKVVASIQFSGWVREQQAGQEGEFSEIWHLAKDASQPNSAWAIEGIQQPG
ncbi:hypothetical protein WH50_21470 [Pokkaliibacter plantistimulans]|uniref:Tim44-like domain-containing protein n=2 Tax=Pokkaliibacter plantistimulans TaxID=1635171 RepID=A0ABX5LXB5_9GAMM|nr:hypothetical protein WH50_21470 [Pokkaliibacter plantistimulans]